MNRFIGDITENLDKLRKPLNEGERSKISIMKLYPYYGANGIISYIDKYLFDEELLCVAEDGGSWGYNQKCAYIIKNKCWVNNHAHVLRMKPEINIKYLMYYLNYKNLNKHISGAVVRKLNQKALSNIEVRLISLEEQKRIVTELDKISNAIENRKDMLNDFDNFLESKFNAMFGSVDNNLFNYKIDSISNLCELKSGTTFKLEEELTEGDIMYAKVSDMNLPGNTKYMATAKRYVLHSTARNSIIPKGSIIFPKRGAAIATNKKRITVSDMCVDLNIMSVIPGQQITSEYLFRYFKSLDLGKLYNGSSIPQINNCDINPLKILVPPISKQEEFNNFVSNVEKQQTLVEKDIEDLESLLDSKMHEYFD